MSNIYRSINEPKNRNPLRLKLGVAYFTLKKHLFWTFGGLKFARRSELCSSAMLEHKHFTHQTPLLRHLRGIDVSLEQNKITNLHLALSKINGIILQPGEAFSFWRMIGRPTRRKGYLEGVILRKGAFESGIGGGLCHLSGFIYWMTLHTPLTVTERHRHGYDTTLDKFFGSDATCFYNYKDLMIKNNTSQPFQLWMEIGEDYLRGAWISDVPPICKYEIYQKEHLIHKEDWGGHTRHNILHRKIYDLNDALIDDEFVAENHAIMLYPPEEGNA